ncbi:MAG: hypothetical protein GTN81_10735 [Proteobacteria bacterium]|nr:hypothetical protein [Pseudomonadota bacterium]
MNRLVEDLAAFCNTHRLEEKVFVSPSLALGHQVTEALVRSGHPWVNLHVETVHTLARKTIDTDLARAGLRILSRAQALALIEQTCSRTLSPEDYFGRLKDQPGFHRALKATIEDLRGAAVTPGGIRPEPFEDGRKARELRLILDCYEKALAHNHLVDEADVLQRALEKFTNKENRAPADALYLLPENLDLSSLEREFLERIAEDRIYVLATDDPVAWKANSSTINIFHAVGEENEVREVFRRLLHEGIEVDKAEILYTDTATYLPLIYELSSQYDMPCTYAEGIPIIFSRPGQAALGYLEWLDNDYDAGALTRTIEAEVLDLGKVTGDGESAGAVRAARVLRDAGVGWGRERHLSCLDALLLLYKKGQRRKEERGATPSQGKFHQRQIRAVTVVRSFVEAVLKMTPEADADGKIALGALACGGAGFVRTFARVASELDGMASMALQKILEELSFLPDIRLRYGDAIKRLQEALGSAYTGARTPEPGHLHVSDYRLGGYSGREVTFIVGLDDSRCPGGGLQDPVLLDFERRDLNSLISPRRLPLPGERPQENRLAFWACLAQLRGRITVSYSCRNLLEDREQFPAPLVLKLYRSVREEPEADYRALRVGIGRPAGFIPADSMVLDETGWWLERLRESGSREDAIAAVVRQIYPWLRYGWQAEQERSSDRFTVFDGQVRDSGGELDPRISRDPMSCTQIEAIARCPFAYFLRYVLGIEPPNDYARDPTLWLNALEFGSLIHEIFRLFMVEITARQEKPNFAHHWANLKRIAEEQINRWHTRVPSPSIAAFTTQRSQILRACRTFLKDEEIHCQQVTPRYFEVPFGLSSMASDSPIGSSQPVSIDLGEGEELLLRGRIDRVDQRGRDEYEVWDYKSGSAHSLREDKLLNRGRQIQHALYARALEILLARAHQEGRVVTSGYFFPGPRGEGQRVVKKQDRSALNRVLRTLFHLLREGVFPYALDSDDCRFCDYQCVCEGPRKTNERILMKFDREGTGETGIDAFKRLMNCDD